MNTKKDPRFLYTAIGDEKVKIHKPIHAKMNVYVKGRHAGRVPGVRMLEMKASFIVGFPYHVVKKDDGVHVWGSWLLDGKKTMSSVVLPAEVCKRNLIYKSKYNT